MQGEKMEKLHNKYKEIEKRIKFNENAMRDDTSIINDLKEDIETLEDDVNILNLAQVTQQQAIQQLNTNLTQAWDTIDSLGDEVALLNLETEAHATDISDLNETINAQSTAIESNSVTLNSHSEALASHDNILDTHSESLSTQGSAIESTQILLQSHSTTLSSHESILTNHSLLIGNLSQDTASFNSSIKDLHSIVNQCAFEPIYSVGGYSKINMGTKSPIGPYCTIFTRVSPGTQFTGQIKLYLLNIPSNQIASYINFYINEDMTRPKIDIVKNKPCSMIINFDFFTTQISNVFKIQLDHTNLANTILNYAEIVTENARNFLCLNRDIEYVVNSFYANDKIHNLYTEQKSNVGRFVYESFDYEANADFASGQKIISIPNSSLNITRSHLARRLLLGSYSALIDQLSIAGENSELYKVTKQADNTAGPYNHWLLFDNVYDASGGYHWRDGIDDICYCVCGTTLNQQIFIGDDHVTENDIPTLNSTPFPNEFITCTAVKDLYAMGWEEHKEIGYLLLHNSGKIFYIAEDDTNYFVEIGLGTQPNAYLQEDRKTIHIYYHFNNIVCRKKMILNEETNRWELGKEILMYPGMHEVVEFDENNLLLYSIDGTRQVKVIS